MRPGFGRGRFTEMDTTSAAQATTVTSSSTAEPALSDPRKGKPLTARQLAIYDLVRDVKEGGQGKTQAEAGAMLGISRPVVNKTMQVVYRKLGISKGKGHGISGEKTSLEAKKPEVAAVAIDSLADPFGRVQEAMAAAGLPEKVSTAVLRRLRVKYSGAISEVKSLKTQEILDLLGKKIDMGLQYLDDKVFSEASARDIMLGLGVMIEKRQLLRGEPTQIISNDDRRKLHELLPALIAEGRRRGITVEGTVTEKTVE